jgi:enterochelin esterase family protein
MLRRMFIPLAAAFALSSCGVPKYAADAAYSTLDPGLRYDGILEECFHDCSVEGPAQRRMYVYLPEGYYESDERYPVLYLLHGARGNELSWIMKGALLHNIDSLISLSVMKETIVVLPNVNQYDDEQDFGKSRLKGTVESFFETDGMVEAAFVDDVVATVDSLYRTIPDKDHRAIAGLSIGAMQSMYISANAPDEFGYVGLFSSMVHPILRKSECSFFYKRLKHKMEVQFAEPPQMYSIMIGKTDIYYLRMKSFARYLSRNGYPFEMYVSKGGHQWYNWEAFANSFMQMLWK